MLAAVATLGAVSCSSATTAGTTNDPVHPAAAVHQAGETRPVRRDARAPSATDLRLPGFVAPVSNVVISTTVAEPATKIYVEEGDVVRRGQVLAQLETTDLDGNLQAAQRSAGEADAKVAQSAYQGRLAIAQGVDAVAAAQDAVAQALAKLAVDRRNLDRDRALTASGDLPQQTTEAQLQLVVNDLAAVRSARSSLQSARTTVAVNGNDRSGLQASSVGGARAAAAAARAQISIADAQLSKATIRSPIDGVVVNRNLNPGEYPGNRAIFTLQDLSSVYALLNASTSQTFAVRPGMPVAITIDRGGPAIAHGVVVAVLGQSVPGSTNFAIKVRVANPSRRLQSGMLVTGIVHVPLTTTQREN